MRAYQAHISGIVRLNIDWDDYTLEDNSRGKLTQMDDSTGVLSVPRKKRRAFFLGLAFLILLILSSVANAAFFNTLSSPFENQLLVFSIIFANNAVVVSLILLGMTFYVDLVVLGFFKKEKHANVVLEHPQIFAFVFAFIVLFLSILRGANLFLGRIVVETLPTILLVSTPIGLVEGYGIYLTIRKTLSRIMTFKDLVCIYGIFLVAALIEVCFINILK